MGTMSKTTNTDANKKEIPSFCGSHSFMINEEETNKFRSDDKNLGIINNYDNTPVALKDISVLQDNEGLYVTLNKNIDNGLADVYRYGREASRIKKFKQEENHDKKTKG